ncbi:MAG: IS110 family transposase [Terriglobia bacterium]
MNWPGYRTPGSRSSSPCFIRAESQPRRRAVRRQKTDTRDAEHLLGLLVTKRFPRIWIPTPQEPDLRQLLKHRDKLVRMQTSVKNQLHFLAISQGCAGSGSCGARAAAPSWKS